MNQLGERIKDARKAQKMTQKELAEGICTQATISNLEKGESFPSITIISAITERLSISMEVVQPDLPEESQHTDVFEKLRLLSIQFKHLEGLALAKKEIEFEKLTSNYEKKLYYYYLGRNHLPEADKLSETLHYFNLVLLIEIEKGVDIIEVMAINGIGAAYAIANEIETATLYFERAIFLLEEVKLAINLEEYSAEIAKIYYNTAKFYSQIGAHHQAIEYCQLGIDLQKNLSVYYYLDVLFYEWGFNAMQLNLKSEAEKYYSFAATLARLNGNQVAIDAVKNDMEKYEISGYKYW